MFNVQCSMLNAQCSMFNVRPRQFAYACGTPLGQRGGTPVTQLSRNVHCSMFNACWGLMGAPSVRLRIPDTIMRSPGFNPSKTG